MGGHPSAQAHTPAHTPSDDTTHTHPPTSQSWRQHQAQDRPGLARSVKGRKRSKARVTQGPAVVHRTVAGLAIPRVAFPSRGIRIRCGRTATGPTPPQGGQTLALTQGRAVRVASQHRWFSPGVRPKTHPKNCRSTTRRPPLRFAIPTNNIYFLCSNYSNDDRYPSCVPAPPAPAVVDDCLW